MRAGGEDGRSEGRDERGREGIGDGRWEMGRWEGGGGDGRWEGADGRVEMGGRRWEGGDGRVEMGGGRGALNERWIDSDDKYRISRVREIANLAVISIRV